ncbi:MULTISPECIES: putative lipid II flippase FtsW [Acidithrix]|uniref:Probable peptidoglycan glycosyltransferase FtsW n=1 Tax=Acidithrix ferrooxidans TaxID=1280514 RepID=A0A0D8HMA2_9ACTN|nr:MULTISPECIES: putative lipid II flippase FtsW [Acidithrix]KJF19043.1 lipid II flippase FtsW [Acidithrix ferrooxidans]CAG4901176.1 unnamed protein product [Acidithrix sp. C25]
MNLDSKAKPDRRFHLISGGNSNVSTAESNLETDQEDLPGEVSGSESDSGHGIFSRRRTSGRLGTLSLDGMGYDELEDELSQSDRIYERSSLSFSLIALVLVLLLVGSAMVLSTSFVPSLGLKGSGSPFSIFERQAIWIVMGLFLFFGIARINPKRIAPFARLGIVPAIVFLIIVLVPGVGLAVGGAKRWLGISFLRFQPSEFAKLAVILYLAGFFTPAVPIRLQRFSKALPAILLVGLICGQVLLEPDMGTAMVVGSILIGMLFLAGMRMRVFAPFAFATICLATVAALARSYRRQRLLSFLHPWQNRLSYSYQEVQGLVAFATGGVHGVGIGAGSAKWGYLPNSQTDFIFAVIGQEAGVIGGLFVLGLLAGLTYAIFRVGLRAPSRFEFLVCIGMALWVGSQTLLNIGAVLGLLPVTGVPLPLISAGGSSLLFMMAGLGIVLGVARHSDPSLRR